MKKILFWSILTLLFTASCSKDDIDQYQPQAGEIKLVFDAGSDNSEAFFYIKGKGIRINWGDGKSEDKELASLSKVSHQYSTLDKEYIITINYTSIEEFGNTDNSAIFAYRTIGSKYKLIAFGEGVQIPKLYFESDLGSALNVSSTSKFNDVYLLLADNEFDLGCFENKTIGFLEIRIMTHGRNVDLNNMKIGGLNIVLHETTPIGSITINSCRNMAGFNCYGRYRKGNVFASMGDLIINDAPELFFFNFDYLNATGLLINEADKLRDVVLWASSVRGPIKFSNSIEKLTIAESIEIENGITSLDVSNCIKLKELRLDTKSLETINFGQLPDLKIIGLNNCYQLKKIEIDNLPSLYYFSFMFSDPAKTLLLEHIDFTNCPELQYVYVFKTTLKTITAKNNPRLRTVRLDNNNLDENSLLGLLKSLTDEPLPSGETRSVTINGNPGVTQAVRDEAAKLKNWIVGI